MPPHVKGDLYPWGNYANRLKQYKTLVGAIRGIFRDYLKGCDPTENPYSVEVEVAPLDSLNPGECVYDASKRTYTMFVALAWNKKPKFKVIVCRTDTLPIPRGVRRGLRQLSFLFHLWEASRGRGDEAWIELVKTKERSLGLIDQFISTSPFAVCLSSSIKTSKEGELPERWRPLLIHVSPLAKDLLSMENHNDPRAGVYKRRADTFTLAPNTISREELRSDELLPNARESTLLTHILNDSGKPNNAVELHVAQVPGGNLVLFHPRKSSEEQACRDAIIGHLGASPDIFLEKFCTFIGNYLHSALYTPDLKIRVAILHYEADCNNARHRYLDQKKIWSNDSSVIDAFQLVNKRFGKGLIRTAAEAQQVQYAFRLLRGPKAGDHRNYAKGLDWCNAELSIPLRDRRDDGGREPAVGVVDIQVSVAEIPIEVRKFLVSLAEILQGGSSEPVQTSLASILKSHHSIACTKSRNSLRAHFTEVATRIEQAGGGPRKLVNALKKEFESRPAWPTEVPDLILEFGGGAEPGALSQSCLKKQALDESWYCAMKPLGEFGNVVFKVLGPNAFSDELKESLELFTERLSLDFQLAADNVKLRTQRHLAWRVTHDYNRVLDLITSEDVLPKNSVFRNRVSRHSKRKQALQLIKMAHTEALDSVKLTPLSAIGIDDAELVIKNIYFQKILCAATTAESIGITTSISGGLVQRIPILAGLHARVSWNNLLLNFAKNLSHNRDLLRGRAIEILVNVNEAKDQPLKIGRHEVPSHEITVKVQIDGLGRNKTDMPSDLRDFLTNPVEFGTGGHGLPSMAIDAMALRGSDLSHLVEHTFEEILNDTGFPPFKVIAPSQAWLKEQGVNSELIDVEADCWGLKVLVPAIPPHTDKVGLAHSSLVFSGKTEKPLEEVTHRVGNLSRATIDALLLSATPESFAKSWQEWRKISGMGGRDFVVQSDREISWAPRAEGTAKPITLHVAHDAPASFFEKDRYEVWSDSTGIQLLHANGTPTLVEVLLYVESMLSNVVILDYRFPDQLEPRLSSRKYGSNEKGWNRQGVRFHDIREGLTDVMRQDLDEADWVIVHRAEFKQLKDDWRQFATRKHRVIIDSDTEPSGEMLSFRRLTYQALYNALKETKQSFMMTLWAARPFHKAGGTIGPND